MNFSQSSPKTKKTQWAPQVFVPGSANFIDDIPSRTPPPSGYSIAVGQKGSDYESTKRPSCTLSKAPSDPRLPGRDSLNSSSSSIQQQLPRRGGDGSSQRHLASPKPSPNPQRTSHHGSPTTTTTSTHGSGSDGRVSWGGQLFVVQNETPNTTTTTPPKRRSGKAANYHDDKILTLTRKDTIIGDVDILDLRWEWSQLLASKVFKPYRIMMCEQDDDLPNPEDLDEIDENDMEQEQDEGMKRIRHAMLNDGNLSEHTIAAFFEGYKMFQLKLRSLQSQLDGLRAVQRMPNRAQSIAAYSVTSSSLPQPKSMVSPRAEHGSSSSSQPPIVSPRTVNGSSSSSYAPRMLSIRAQSIKKVKETSAKDGNVEIQRLLTELEEAESRQKKLERQLAQLGVIVAEDIPFEEAKRRVEEIALRMHEIGGSDVTNDDKKKETQLRQEYFKLEQDMEKYTTALQLTDEWIQEQKDAERNWEEFVKPGNLEALKMVRRHMPVDVRNMGEEALTTTPTPSGKYLPPTIARKFKRTNVLQLLRVDPDDIMPMHPSTLENMRVTGLTLTERRALYAHLIDIGPRWKAMQGDKMTERKWTWYTVMRNNLKEQLASYQRHVDQYGPPENHSCTLIGNQCPVRANMVINYKGDYGYTEEAAYFKSGVQKSSGDDPGARAKQEALEALREKKASHRADGLKEHYKGKVLQVCLASGSCESMDEAMDRMEAYHEKWIKSRLTAKKDDAEELRRKEPALFCEALNELKLSLLQFAERSGMHLTGKRDANADQPDLRSAIELGLCEEVLETIDDFFNGLKKRMEELEVMDGRMKSTIGQLQQLMDELHERNLRALKRLGCERPPRSRKLKTRKAIELAVKSNLHEDTSKVTARAPSGGVRTSPSNVPPRGGLLAALAGRGGGGGDGGPRGGLMAALQARGGG
jgi:hypothetical protein